jgi:L-alanine-DL-glutamate epimerase-like enolase superfamily enzyme
VRITDVECHVLLDPDYDIGATSSAQDDIVVEIHTDEGISGVGETDVNPWMARAAIQAPGTHTMGQGLTEMLLGSDPMDVEGIWDRLYVGSAMNGRRGVVVNAIGAIDIALHDLRGKALGRPCHELLGGAVKDAVTPYASLQPEVSSFGAYRDSLVAWAIDARQQGFTAAKAEVILRGPYAHKGLLCPDHRTTEVVAAVRDAVGQEFTLMVDVGYAWDSPEVALATLGDWQPFGLFFVETPVASDDLAGLARVATGQPIPIAAGEWLTTRFEFADLMDRGQVKVAQPDIGRVGGLTEAMRVAQMAADRGLTIVPHLWKTGISIAAATHLAAVTPHCPFIEFLPGELSASNLRKQLLEEEPRLQDGVIPLPTAPGLGIKLNRDALARFKEAARKVMP